MNIVQSTPQITRSLLKLCLFSSDCCAMSMRAMKSSTRSSFVVGARLRCAVPKRARVASRQVTLLIPAASLTVLSAKVTRAAYETQLIMSTANAVFLALGRWGFLKYQRTSVENAGLPVQNGVTHADAGDVRAQEASFLTATNDPAGFTLIDVLAWGSIGHIVGFILLATNDSLSLG